ncbi:hypothetical protein AJ80_03725 [Polytolypa hystricis UAMH7299]|uniref:Uncharacterized protein n=1 Tax=Polytolypa hystricis (strain UAMH7299) TaxID=1447883 RepID=A0A2B7YFM8_POLH7|nr:hypothetical protein AJ80_03725 [Polytolypa hystricis UAMH7299]
MKLALLAVSVALCSAKAIPPSFDVNPQPRRGDALSWETFSLEGRQQKEMTFEQVKAAVAKEYNAQVPDGTLKLKWDFKPECSKCKDKQVQDEKDKAKCRDCKKGTKPNPNHTKCIRDDTGCAEDEIQTPDKQCQKCDANKVADDTGKACKDKDANSDKKGKCPDGQILDPAQGGQDANTEKPKCIGDDDKKCPEGETAETRRANRKVDNEADYEPSCAPDDDPNHKCDDKNTYDHRHAVDGKIKHTCRSTRKTQEDKQKKYKERVDSAKGKKDVNDKDKRNKARRTRAGWCWLMLASIEAPAFTTEELQDLTQDELDGMIDTWPDENILTPPDEGEIPDHKVKISPILRVSTVGESSAAGFGGIASAVIRFFAKLFGKAGKGSGGGGSSGIRSAVKELKTGGRSAASGKAIQSAKSSTKVQKMLKEPRYLDCLSTAPAIMLSHAGLPQNNKAFDGSSAEVDVDWSRKPDPKLKPLPEGTEDQRITLHFSDETDKSHSAIPLQTYHDSYIRAFRLYYEACQKPKALYDLDNKITDVNTQGGCCAFYDGGNCEADTIMFAMTNRQDGKLRGDHDNAISSFWCTFDLGCNGAPGM